MSLINEALKKAQSERPTSTHQHPAMQGVAMQHPPQKPKRKRRYLFGFLLSVLIVGLLSTAVSTYLVFQILGDSEPESNAEVKQVATNGEPDTQQTADTSLISSTSAEQESVVSPEPAAGETTEEPVVEEVVAQNAPVPAAEVPVKNTQTQELIPQQPILAEPGTYPETWSRLQLFEIRGIMSGGTKVLIFDQQTSKARSYKPGDQVDYALSLKISSIEPNLIYFENHDGVRFPISF